MRVHETKLTAAWRQYCQLYPEELRQTMIAAVARLIGTGTQADADALALWTMRGCDGAEHHETFLAGFHSAVTLLWELKAGGHRNEVQLQTQVSELFDDLASLGVEVDIETPFDRPHNAR